METLTSYLQSVSLRLKMSCTRLDMPAESQAGNHLSLIRRCSNVMSGPMPTTLIDETPACISEQRGMQRAWFWPEEKYDNNVKHDCIQKYCKLQFMELSRIITKVLAISTPRRQRQRQEL
ncbi:hypothetical protein PMIN04_012463 [Paraphaeosphaeria minitans]